MRYLSGWILPVIMILTAFIECLAGPYAYPVLPGSTEWKEAGSYEDRVKLCNIPQKILSDMTTEDLLETVLAFPFITNLSMYDDIHAGFENLRCVFNGLDELAGREDAAQIIMDKYILADPGSDDLKRTVFQILLSQEPFSRNLNKKDKERLLNAELEKIKAGIEDKTFIHSISLKNGCFLIADIMLDLEVESFKARANSDENLKLFTENSKYTDWNVISSILLEAVRFNNELSDQYD